jgi:PAS domain S-box-containing protein
VLDRCTTRLQLTEKLFEHVADAVFVADLDGRIIDVNPAACWLLGYATEELLKMRPWDFATSASWEGILGSIRSGAAPVQMDITGYRLNPRSFGFLK